MPVSVAGLGILYRVYRASIPAATVGRCVLAMTLVILAGRMMPDASKLATMGESGLLVCVYILVLAAARELKRADWAVLRRIVARR